MPSTAFTDGPLSRIGLGLAALGRPGYINLGHAADLEGRVSVAALRDRTHEVLDEAWSAGIRYFDTARSYGKAEEFLGGWLQRRAVDPDEVTVGSKWGYTYTANWQIEVEKHEVKEHSLAILRRQWAETRANLGGHLDLYQIHSATLDSGVLDKPDVLAELARLKAAGTWIGLSLSGPGQGDTLRRAIPVEVDGRRLFDATQATWNLLEPSAGPALAEAGAAGMAVIVKEALANARLTERNREPDFAGKLRLLREEAARLNASVDALVLAAALAQPWATVVLSGAVTVAQLRSNLTALRVAWDANAAARLAGLAEPPEAYWATRSDLPWN